LIEDYKELLIGAMIALAEVKKEKIILIFLGN